MSKGSLSAFLKAERRVYDVAPIFPTRRVTLDDVLVVGSVGLWVTNGDHLDRDVVIFFQRL